jgi:regulator of protease activity HflC (stomatin/prohibitin superfamily)
MKIDVALNERVLVAVNGQPVRYLGAGRHRVWIAPWRKVEVKRLDTDALLANLRAEELALVPAGDLAVVTLSPDERAIVTRRGKPAKWLQAGVHQVWIVDRVERRSGNERVLVPGVTIEVVDVSGVETRPLRDEVKCLVPAGDYVEATAASGTTVVRYVDGALDQVLGAGRHAAWTARRKVLLSVIDERDAVLQIQAQEVMTKDRVTLRLNLAATYRVGDVRRLATVARAPDEVLYLAVQLAVREAVASRTLDELLAAREALAAALRPAVVSRAR